MPSDVADATGSILTKLVVAGMDCGDEVTAIRNALMHPQVLAVTANLMAATVEVRHFPSLTKEFLRQKIEKTGIKVVSETDSRPSVIDRRKAILVTCSGALLAM